MAERNANTGIPAMPSLVVIGLLLAFAPVLLLPQLVPVAERRPSVVLATVLALVGAAALAGTCRLARVLTTLLAVIVAVAGLRTPLTPEGLSHFAGAGMGLFSMSALAWLSRTEERLSIAAWVFVIMGGVVLILGLLNAEIPVAKLAPFIFSEPARQEYLRAGATVSVLELIPEPIKLRMPFVNALFQLFGPPKGGVNANALAGTALLIAPMAWALTFPRALRTIREAGLRVAAAFTGLLATAVLVITQSRAAWVIAVLTVLVFLARSSLSRRCRWVLALGVLVIPAAVLALTFQSGKVTVAHAFESGRSSLAERQEVWAQGFAALERSPLSGIGFNQFRHVYRTPAGSRTYDAPHVHNIWLQTALDLGLLGLLAYAGLMTLLLIRADHATRGKNLFAVRVAAGAGLSLVAVHLFGMLDAVALGAKAGLFQWLAGGLILAAWRLQQYELPVGQPARIPSPEASV